MPTMMSSMVGPTLRWQRNAVATAVAGAAIVAWVEEGDIFTLPKATLIVLAALACLGIAGGRALLQRTILVPRTPSVAAAGLLLLGMTVSTVASTRPMQSLIGQHSQLAGLALYTACVVLFVSVVRAHGEETLPGLVRAVVGVAVPVLLYGLLQWQDLDPLGLGTDQVVSTLGNPNFFAGWLGIVFPLCIALAIARTQPGAWRAVGAGAAVVVVPLSLLTNSFQGPATVGAAGLAFVVLLRLAGGVTVPRRLRGWRGLVAVSALVVVMTPVAATVLADGVDQGLLERRYFWRGAVEVFIENPLVGTGPDTFHNEYLQVRAPEHAALRFSKNAGAAHDVPLDMLANGGLVVGLPYLAFIGLVGWRLVQAVRRRSAPPWLLAGIGAAWFGYQVQSLVSLDKPPLAVLHWTLAGAVVVLGGPVRAWPVRLPGRPAQGPAPTSTVAAVGVLAVILVGAGWVATRPLRADLAAIEGREALDAGDATTAASAFRRARQLAPWEAQYTFDQVRLGALTGDRELFLEAAEEGARLEAGDSSYALVAARAADGLGEEERARRWFDEAIRVDPYGLEPLLTAAQSAADEGDVERARALVGRALDVTTERADVWGRVGRVWAAMDDEDAAREAYRHALDLDPSDEDAARGLAGLDG